jgi:hypothetical protein
MINVGDRVFYEVDDGIGLSGTAYEKLVYGNTTFWKLRLENNDVLGGITVEENSLKVI